MRPPSPLPRRPRTWVALLTVLAGAAGLWLRRRELRALLGRPPGSGGPLHLGLWLAVLSSFAFAWALRGTSDRVPTRPAVRLVQRPRAEPPSKVFAPPLVQAIAPGPRPLRPAARPEPTRCGGVREQNLDLDFGL